LCLGFALIFGHPFADQPEKSETWALPILAVIHQPKTPTAGYGMGFIVNVQLPHSAATMKADKPVTNPSKVRAAFSERNRGILPIVPPVCNGGGDHRVQYIRKELIGIGGLEARLLLEICGVDGGA
jgi:hypothetical protein